MNNIIISNTCLGAFIYKYTNTEYTTPFIWCIVNDNDMLYCLEHYNEINFNNYKLIKIFSKNSKNRLSSGFRNINRDIYGIRVDNKFNIYFPHYYESNEKMIIENGMSAKGENIGKYILEKYKDRFLRINNKTPLFILETDIKHKDKPVKDKVLNMFYNAKSNYNKILLTYDESLLNKYKNTENITVVYTPVHAVEDKARLIIDKFKDTLYIFDSSSQNS